MNSRGMRALSCSSQAVSTECPGGSSKQKCDPSNAGSVIEAAVLHTEALKKPYLNDANHTILAKERVDFSNDPSWQCDLETEFSSSAKCCEQDRSLASTTTKNRRQAGTPPNKENIIGISMPHNDGVSEFSNSPTEAEGNVARISSLSYDLTSLKMNECVEQESSGSYKSKSLVSDPHFIGSPENHTFHQQLREEHYNESLTSTDVTNGIPSGDESSGPHKLPGVHTEVEEDVLSFDSQRLQDPEFVSHKAYSSNLIAPLHPSEKFSNTLQPRSIYSDSGNNVFVHSSSGSAIPNGHAGSSLLNPVPLRMNGEQSLVRGTHVGTLQGEVTNCQGNGAPDAGESSIISNMLSLDFDPWNDSLASSHNLAKLFGETDRKHGSINATNNWKVQNNSQSRFSFARHEESISQPFDAEPSFNVYGQLPRNRSIDDDKEFYLHKRGISNGFPSQRSAEIGNFSGTPHTANKSSGESVLLL